MGQQQRQPYTGEERILVPSQKVATYDLKPEMSCPEVTEKLCAAIRSRAYDLIVCNLANADMVGSGQLPEERAEGCEDEWKQLSHAWSTLLDEHWR